MDKRRVTITDIARKSGHSPGTVSKALKNMRGVSPGTRAEITTDLKSIVSVIRKNTDVPCAIGFGISTPDMAARMAKEADGVIVGSAIIKILAARGREAAPCVGSFVKDMKDAIC